MFKFLLPVVLIGVTLTSCAAAHSPKTPQEIIAQVTPSVVKIDRDTPDGNEYTCAGFVVDSTLKEVITARHCVSDGLADPVNVDGKPARTIKYNDGYALINAPNLDKPRLSLAKHMPVVGQQLFSFGWGYEKYTFLMRRVVWFVRGLKDMSAFTVDGILLPGMSGGPVVDEEGNVVGLNQMSSSETMMGLVGGVDEIKDFIK